MNKRNIIKIILSLISLILIISFQIAIKDFGFVYLIPLLFLVTVYMHKYKNKITKYKFIYDVVLMLLMFFSLLLLIYISVVGFNSSDNIITELPIVLNLFNIYFILKILIDNIVNFRNENNKINDYLIIITFSIINLVFIRYYFDINIVIPHEMTKIEFVNQNYIYFFIMLVVTEIHKCISNK